MSTATAYATRPLVYTPHKVELDLVPAVKEDFREYDGTDHNGEPKYKRRIGMIYWLFSQSQAKMMPTPYMITEASDPKELKEYLDAGIVFVSRNPFRE